MEDKILPLRIGVGIVVLNSDNKVFVGKRKDNPVDRWQMPQGGVDPGETLLEAMKRELIEETGLNPEKLWTIDKVNIFYDANRDIMNLIPVFGVTVNATNIVISKEHSEYKWCNINETIKLLTWEQQKKGIKIFHEMLKENGKRLKIMEIKI